MNPFYEKYKKNVIKYWRNGFKNQIKFKSNMELGNSYIYLPQVKLQAEKSATFKRQEPCGKSRNHKF